MPGRTGQLPACRRLRESQLAADQHAEAEDGPADDGNEHNSAHRLDDVHHARGCEDGGHDHAARASNRSR